jgi:hypothetical protein
MNGALVVTDWETRDEPLGLLMEIVVAPPVLVIVLLDVSKLSLWPAVPSKTTKPMLLAVLIVTVRFPPTETRLLKPTLDAPKEPGGTKKSLVLEMDPLGVLKTSRPEVAPLGTDVDRLVVVAEETSVDWILNFSLSFAETVSKFVPLTDTEVPGVPMLGLILEIVGWPAPEVVTVKLELLVADPAGVVTLTVPVVAPEGTETTREVTVALVTVAVVPLNFTVSCEGVVLNAVPYIVTVLPTLPLFGLSVMTDSCWADPLEIERMFPTES